MTEADRRRAAELLTFTTNMEHAGDVVERDLLAIAARSVKRGQLLGPLYQAQLTVALDRVVSNVRRAASLLINADLGVARLLVEDKLAFRGLEDAAAGVHFEALRTGAAPEISALLLDLLRNIRRINAHLVAAAAYPVLENCGELLPSRLSSSDPAGDEA